MTLVDPKTQLPNKIVFAPPVQKMKDQRMNIDYLAKRQRRMDLEDNARRQEERKIELLN